MEQILGALGVFGWYQRLLFALVCYAAFWFGAQGLLWSWTGFEPDTRCCVPAIDGGPVCAAGQANYSTVFVLHDDAIYPSATDRCHVCDYNTTVAVDQPCTADMHPHDCGSAGVVYDLADSDMTSSLYVLFDLGCANEWKYDFVWSMMTVGQLISGLLIGPIADKFGRRPCLLWLAAVSALLVTALCFATNYVAYLLLTLVASGTIYGVFLCVYVIFMEMMSSGVVRTFLSMLVFDALTVGQLYVGLVAWLTRDWRWLQALFAVPVLGFIPFFWLLPESIRWLITDEQPERARLALARAEHMNNRRVPEDVLKQELAVAVRADDAPKQSVLRQAVQLYSNWNIAKNTTLMFITWFATSMSYYGLAQNTQNLPGNAFEAYSLGAAVQLVTPFVCVPMMQYLGRKPTIVFGLVVGGASCVICGVLQSSASDTVIMVLALFGRFWMNATFVVIYQYAAELFPTVVRQTAIGLCSVFARFGSLLAPQIHLLAGEASPALPIILYGSVAVVAGLLDLLLPETKARQLPETIEDAKHF